MKCQKKEVQFLLSIIIVPFVFYADFEAFTEEVVSTCEPNDKFSFTKQYQKHQPSGFCYKCVAKKSVLYRGEDAPQKFVEMLERDIKMIYKKFNFSKKMLPLTEKEQSEYEKANICWICRKEFGESKKVRDHWKYQVHSKHEEKYISFSKEIVVGEYINKEGKKVEVKHEIQFINSFKFMASSLASLVENLAKSDLSKFIHTKKEFGKNMSSLQKKEFIHMII